MDFSWFYNSLLPTLGGIFGILAAVGGQPYSTVSNFFKGFFSSDTVSLSVTNLITGTVGTWTHVGNPGFAGFILDKINRGFWTLLDSFCSPLSNMPFAVCLVYFVFVFGFVLGVIKFFIGLFT